MSSDLSFDSENSVLLIVYSWSCDPSMAPVMITPNAIILMSLVMYMILNKCVKSTFHFFRCKKVEGFKKKKMFSELGKACFIIIIKPGL